jgi:hypothetical protein
MLVAQQSVLVVSHLVLGVRLHSGQVSLVAGFTQLLGATAFVTLGPEHLVSV